MILVCLYCKKEFETAYKHRKNNQKYCSAKCRNKHFQITHRQYCRNYAKEYRKRTSKYCKECGKILTERIMGQVYCKPCSKKRYRESTRKSQLKIQAWFDKYKENQGCSHCGYSDYGGSLDYHHVNPNLKRTRISAEGVHRKSKKVMKEIKKCLLLCKNCHYTLHHRGYLGHPEQDEKIMLNNSNSEIPILVVSKKNEPLYLFDALERGAVDYIAVPINEDQLISKVEKIIPDDKN